MGKDGMDIRIWGVPQGRLKGAKEEAPRPGWRPSESLMGNRALFLGIDIRARARDKAQRCLEEGSKEQAVDIGAGGRCLSSALVLLSPEKKQALRCGWAGPRCSYRFAPRYGMRYVAKVLKTTLAEKFPDATESEVYKASVVFHPPPLKLTFALMVPVNPHSETKG